MSTQSCSVSNNVSVYSTSLTYTCLQIPIKGEILGCDLIQPNNFYYYTTTIFKMKVSLSKQFTLSDAERRFRRACDQIVLLNQKLGEVQKRYKNARRTNNRSFRYNLRLKLAVVEGCAQHVLRLCLRKSWPSSRSSKRTFQRICGNRFWFWFRLHVWYRIEGVNRMSFPPKRPFSEPTQISRKKAFKLSLNHPRIYTCPLPSASYILVPGLKTIFLLWKPPYSTSNFHLRMLDPKAT